MARKPQRLAELGEVSGVRILALALGSGLVGGAALFLAGQADPAGSAGGGLVIFIAVAAALWKQGQGLGTRLEEEVGRPLRTVGANLAALQEGNLKVERTGSSVVEINDLLDREIALVSRLREREKEAEAKIRKLSTLASVDSLTGLPNRLALAEKLEKTGEGWLVILKLENLVALNGFYGHQFGDYMLKQVANALREPYNRRVYRYSGDAMALLLEKKGDQSPEAMAEEALERITGIKAELGGVVAHPEVCGGIGDAGQSQAMEQAEMALKEARAYRKNSVKLFQSDNPYATMLEQNVVWSRKLQAAFADDRVVPFYHALYDVKAGKVALFEALVRFIDENGNPVSPFFFLEVAKNTGLYPKITKTVMENAFAAFAGSEYGLSVNITVNDILNLDLADFVSRLFQEAAPAPERVMFELTAEFGMEKNPLVTDFLARARRAGCKIAIDNFGAGYDSFAQLMAMEADYVKIAGGLVKNVCENEKNRIAVESIVGFCRKAGIGTMATFVHNEEVFDLLKGMGVDYVQGSFISDAVPMV